jgi:phosphoribosylaminoimidazole-succinocarboxamide synthase
MLSGQLLYEGKSKRVYVKDENMLLMEFKDVVTALDGVKVSQAPGKGVLNAALSAFFFRLLESRGVNTHFISYDGGRVLTVRRLKIVPVEVIVRNYAYGSLIKRLPLYKPLSKLGKPIVEYHYKSDELHDPLILPEDILNTGLMSEEELNTVNEVSLRVNEVLSSELVRYGLTLIDFKLEFGRDADGRLLVADEISGDTIRVIDAEGRHLDKEVFRRGGSVEDLLIAYSTLARRLGIKVVLDVRS